MNPILNQTLLEAGNELCRKRMLHFSLGIMSELVFNPFVIVVWITD